MTNDERLKFINYIRDFLEKAEDSMNERDEDAYQKAIDRADALMSVLHHEDMLYEDDE